MKRGGRSILIAVVSLMLASVWLAGCSSSSSGGGSESMNSASVGSATADMAMDVAAVEAEAAVEADAAPAEAPMEPGFGTSGDGSSGAPQAPQASRMLIYTANLTMEVEKYGDAYSKLQDLIHLTGGYIVGFSEETSEYEKTGLFTIKVPANGFNGFLSKLEQIPSLSLNRSLKAQDVSEEYVDLESRLKAKQVVEQRLLAFMEKAVKTDDLVKFSNELARVQEEIERMKGRMRYLEHNVAYSTVELRLYQKLEGGLNQLKQDESPSLSERMGKAVQNSFNVLVTVFEGLLIIFAGLLPVVAVGGVVGVPLYYLWKRSRRNHTDRVSKQTESLIPHEGEKDD
jgi:hypothetical protein